MSTEAAGANGKFAFDEKNEKRFQETLKRYPTKMAVLLPALWIAPSRQPGTCGKAAPSPAGPTPRKDEPGATGKDELTGCLYREHLRGVDSYP